MAAYTSVTGGDWNNPATWGSASYPSVAGDTATITAGHTVIYNVNDLVELGNISVYGTLRVSKSMTTTLATSGNMAIGAAAVFDWGTIASPVPAAYIATIQFNANTSLTSSATAIQTIHGDPTYQPIKKTTLVSNWTSGSSITVSGDLTSAWRIGDEVVVEKNRYISVSHTAGFFKGTIKTLTLSGGNTIIEFNEAFSTACYIGGYVFNLNYANVIIKKKVAPTNLGSWANSASPVVQFTGSTTNRPYIKETIIWANYYSACAFTDYEKVLWRNCNYGLYGASNSSVKNCDIVICQYPTFGNSCFYYYNTFFAACAASAFSGTICSKIDSCRVFGVNAGLADIAYSNEVNNTIVRGCGAYLNICFVNSIFNQCYFYENSWHGKPFESYFNRCSFGYDENGNTTYTYASNAWAWLDIGIGKAYYKDCKINLQPTYEPYVYLSGSSLIGTAVKEQVIYIQNYNQSEGDIRTYGLYGSVKRNASIKNLASCSLLTTPHASCGTIGTITDHGYAEIDIVKWTENDVAASTQNRRVYVYGTGWSSFPTNTQLYLEATYYNSNTLWTTTTAVSTEVINANSTWTALTINFTPSRIGPVTYRVVLAKYVAGALLYLDHALYYTPTQFVEATFDWGESVLPTISTNTLKQLDDAQTLSLMQLTAETSIPIDI